MSGWVLVTRAAAECDALAEALAAHDLRVVAYPTLRDEPVEDDAAWEALAPRIASVGWIAFTSPRAPRLLAEQARSRGLLPALAGVPAAAVGAATASAATAAGFRAGLIGEAGGLALAARLAAVARPGQTVLHACGRDRRRELADALAAAGFPVVPLVVYATAIVPPAELPALPDGAPAAVVLSSPRAAEGYVAACGTRYASVPHVAFGPTTATAAARLGLTPAVLREPTAAALLEELCPTS